MRIQQSRRITGPHMVLDGPGAAAEVVFEGEDAEAWLAQWQQAVSELARRLGWSGHTAVRRWPGGATVALACPVDLALAATDVVEQAAGLGPGEERIAEAIRELERPRLRAAVAASADIGRSCLVEGDEVVFGMGPGAVGFHAEALPDELPSVGQIPFVFVTGTNGKTTTTRLLARMATLAGFQVGQTSSDGIWVAGEWLTRGDWTGPQAARLLLRHPECTFAVLETARGGMMRRGLVCGGARAAVVTNVSADHLGEWGLFDIHDMADAKLTVARGVAPDGVLVVNGDDDALAASIRRNPPTVAVLRFRDGSSVGAEAYALDGHLWLCGEPLVAEAELAFAAGGLLRHGVQNALAAALTAHAMGLPRAAIGAALREFTASVADNRGRMNLFDVRGARVVVDYCHTPDAVAHFVPLVAQWAGRTTVVVGQAGDRTDALIDALGDAVLRLDPARVILKELSGHLRGRVPGEVTGRLRLRLEREGGPQILVAANEREAAIRALAGVREGDLVLLFTHEDLDEVLSILTAAGAVPRESW